MISYFSSRPRILHRAFVMLLAWPLLSGLCLVRVRADEPELTSLLGADVGLCIEIRDLRTHLRDVPSAEWFCRFREMPLVKRWQQGAEFAKWQASQVGLTALIGQPLDQFVSELFGESVVLAISPTKSGPPLAVLLSRAAKEDSWDRVLALWDQLEAHDVQTRSAFGRSFQLRQKKTNGQATGPDLFTVKVGRILAITEREELIREILARAASASNDDRATTLDQSPAYRRAMSALPERSAVRVFVNPRRWDDLCHDTSAWLSPLWQKLDWLSAGIEFRDGVIGHAIIHHDTEGLPIIWRKFVEASETSSDLAERLPVDAVFAGEVRIAPGLLSWLRSLDLSEKSQRDWQAFAKVTHGLLGRDLFENVLPYARPSLGGAIVPKRPVEEHSAPVDGLLAWQFDWPQEQTTTNDQPQLRESLDGALQTLLNFAAVAHNSHNPDVPATLRIQHRDALTIRWLDRLPPYRPAYGITAEHVLLASDPRLISAFQERSVAGPALKSEPLFASVRSQHFTEHSHWLFFHSRAAREFLVEQHEPLSRQIAHWRNTAPPSVTAQLDRVREILTPFDAAFLAAKVSPGEVRFTFGAVAPDSKR